MVLLDALTYYDKSGFANTAPKGSRVNGKSNLRGLWWTKLGGPPFVGPARRSSVIHDVLVARALEVGGKRGQLMRHRADDIFYESMIFDGVGPFKAYVMYRAVRLGAILCASMLLCIMIHTGCRTVERTIRNEHNRTIEKVARPVAREEAAKAVAEHQEKVVGLLMKWAPWVLVGGGGSALGVGGLKKFLRNWNHGAGV